MSTTSTTTLQQQPSPAPVCTSVIISCQNCGADLAPTQHHFTQDAQQRIEELEAQVKILTLRATAAGEKTTLSFNRHSPVLAQPKLIFFLSNHQLKKSLTTKMNSTKSNPSPPLTVPRTTSHTSAPPPQTSLMSLRLTTNHAAPHPPSHLSLHPATQSFSKTGSARSYPPAALHLNRRRPLQRTKPFTLLPPAMVSRTLIRQASPQPPPKAISLVR